MTVESHARPCPMCRSTDWAPGASLYRAGTQFQFASCRACHFVYVLNPPGQTYRHSQDSPSEVPERARHRQIKRICDRQRARARRPDGVGVVVEVGAGWGGLAQVFARDDRYHYVGFEPSADRAAFCRAHGLDVQNRLFEGPGSLQTPADAIVLDNVLEHVEHPDSLVAAAVASLRGGGLLIVIVPNVKDVRQLKRSWRERHHWQPECHINYFAAGDLRQMFARHGLTSRFFGLEAVASGRGDLSLLPRVLADSIGLHLFGLNCYGVKPAA